MLRILLRFKCFAASDVLKSRLKMAECKIESSASQPCYSDLCETVSND